MNVAARIIAPLLLISLGASARAQEPTILKHDGWVAALAFSPDGKTLASAGADKVVRLWEVGAWKPKGVLKGHTDCVCALGFNVYGVSSHKFLATGSYDRTARLWDIDAQKEIWTSAKQTGSVTAVAPLFLLPEKNVLAAGTDGFIRILPEKERKGFKFPQHKSWVNCLTYNENAAATGSSDGTVCVFDNDQKLDFLEAGAGEVRCVAFSPDGKLLAAGNRYGTVRVWDVATRKEIKTITGHMGDVWSIAFSPDGKTLAAVDTDWKKPSKIKLYDTTSWKERGALPMPGEILCIAYSPNGAWLAAGSWDKTVRIFHVAPK